MARDALAGVLSFDPLAFARAKPKEQFDQLRPFVQGIDFEKVDAQNRGDYERRTDANRLAKQAQASADMIVVPAATPDEPVNIAELSTELEAAGTLNADELNARSLIELDGVATVLAIPATPVPTAEPTSVP